MLWKYAYTDNQHWASGMMGGRSMSEMQWTRNADTMWNGGNIAFGQVTVAKGCRYAAAHSYYNMLDVQLLPYACSFCAINHV